MQVQHVAELLSPLCVFLFKNQVKLICGLYFKRVVTFGVSLLLRFVTTVTEFKTNFKQPSLFLLGGVGTLLSELYSSVGKQI